MFFVYPPTKYRNSALFDRKSGVTTSYPALRFDTVIMKFRFVDIIKLKKNK